MGWHAGLRKSLQEGHGLWESLLAIVAVIVVFYIALSLTRRNKKLAYYIYETPALYFYSVTLGVVLLGLQFEENSSSNVIYYLTYWAFNLVAIPLACALFLRMYYDAFIRDR